jgi:hypothetical protein
MMARWKRIKSTTFKSDLTKLFNYITAPVNNTEMPSSEKKRIRKIFATGFTEKLKSKWDYNQRMGERF